MGHPPFTEEQREHHREVMLRANRSRRARRGVVEANDGPVRLLHQHCCTCAHYRCELGYEPDADWLRVWLNEIGDGDPFRTLAMDCADWRKQTRAEENGSRPVSLAYSPRERKGLR